mmetsp:Transcript_36217/g.80584  ORF Transcript_36217/g.80584 Transcript_36217/m.80584 type:complete len:508 (+) Transcript_36217:137-1660(+)|eukprot:CAMPEP_0202920898 /NCGR_PEP_ID=MMETSP1392-20130828/77091_1 /ASSEMBLY_ACC=CAM_ASM_000868 /TAXON_ID=225041 /ORGANISM="Chlamydomonas chlamydogama, Strain SAG 11-48b" /LENGTH=507 /DNA_ID=CAMNT_0049614417 /DNA_START=79 /DNA_END=1602 /DNA_ORIENTATION=+
MRRHGLQLPLDRHQVLSFIVLGFLVSGVYAFYVPLVQEESVRYGLLALYTLVVAVVITFGALSSLSDPSDPGLDGATDGEYFCAICQASVGRTSKHCRACDRCVEGFDHHCKWLNNCVGAANYRAFFSLVCTTVSMLVVQLAWGIWLFARSFYDQDNMTQEVLDAYWGHVNYRGWQVLLALYLLLLIAAGLMLGELLVFHTVLITKNMTTYDYIMAQKVGPPSPSSAPPPNSGPRAALCRSARVMDESMVHAPRRKKVSLNPCKACSTTKLDGDPRSWDSAVASKGVAPGKTAPVPVSEQRVGNMPPAPSPRALLQGPVVRATVQLPSEGQGGYGEIEPASPATNGMAVLSGVAVVTPPGLLSPTAGTLAKRIPFTMELAAAAKPVSEGFDAAAVGMLTPARPPRQSGSAMSTPVPATPPLLPSPGRHLSSTLTSSHWPSPAPLPYISGTPPGASVYPSHPTTLMYQPVLDNAASGGSQQLRPATSFALRLAPLDLHGRSSVMAPPS